MRKKGCCSRVIARDFGGKLMGPGSCVGEGGLSKMVEMIIDTFLRVPWRSG